MLRLHHTSESDHDANRPTKPNETGPSLRVLLADGDPIVGESLAEILVDRGYAVTTAQSSQEAISLLDAADDSPTQSPFAVIVLDTELPVMGGMNLLKTLRKRHPDVVPVMITGFGKLQSAVEAVRLGAADYLTKPIVDDELATAVERAMQRHALLNENAALKNQLSERFGMANLVGSDHRMQKAYDLIEAVAESKTTVLVTGESGTGKSMAARAVHTMSPRANAPFVTFSCGAIPETLLESELFGHVKGAFTGADHDKPGKVLAADGGTLFIDEINSATPALQLKLLRVLQEKAFEPVGSSETRHVDVRFILATNQSLREQVEQGLFREDLYYRINVVSIEMPPLRDRPGDVKRLAEHFVDRYCLEMNRSRRFSETTMDALRAYAWPGNVRELENAVERAVLLSKGPTIEVTDLPERVLEEAGFNGPALRYTGEDNKSLVIPALHDGWTPMPLSAALQEPERQIILAALEANAWNRQETARQLDINRTTLYKKIKHFHLDQPA